MPEKPYKITQEIWEDFYEVQMSGRMNMYGHHYVRYFIPTGAYETAYEHFKVQGNTDAVVIE